MYNFGRSSGSRAGTPIFSLFSRGDDERRARARLVS